MSLVDHIVRRIRAQEWREYRALRLEALTDSPLAFSERYDDLVTREDAFWQDRVQRSSAGSMSCLVVAVHTGQFVGNAGCFVRPEVTDHVSAHVVGVYVTPRWRGHGLADALLAAILSWAREEAHADTIRLRVTEINARATAFYRRIGFVPTGATMPYPPDPAYIEHEMEYPRSFQDC